jgi:hypothetical protein
MNPFRVGQRVNVIVYDYHLPGDHPGLRHAKMNVFVAASLIAEDNPPFTGTVRCLDDQGRSLGWVSHASLPTVRQILDLAAQGRVTYSTTFMNHKYNQDRKSKVVVGPVAVVRITACM